MADFEVHDIPTLLGPRPRGAPHVRRAPALHWARVTRRRFLHVAAGLGISIGLSAVGLLPPARRALATHKLDDGSASKLYPWSANGCPFSYDGDTCNEACGTSAIHGDACFTSGTWAGWHEDHTAGDGTTWKLRPDECASPDYDAWKWKVPLPCNGLAGPTCNSNFTGAMMGGTTMERLGAGLAQVHLPKEDSVRCFGPELVVGDRRRAPRPRVEDSLTPRWSSLLSSDRLLSGGSDPHGGWSGS